MPNSFYMIHPKRGRLLPPTFVTHGRWLGTPAPLWGQVVGPGGIPVAVGRLVRNDRRCWTMVFRDVPVGEGLRLEVTNPATGEVATATDLTIAAFTGVIISYPTDDDLPVGSTFITYGSTTATVALSAYLTPASGTPTYLFGPPDNTPYWAFEFDGVDIGSYTLRVEGGEYAANQTIDVL